MNKRRVTTVVSTVAVLALAGSAAAATPRSLQYGNGGVTTERPPSGVLGGGGGEKDVTLPEAVSESLPFTGFQAALVLIGGAGIAGTGLALRRIGRPS